MFIRNKLVTLMLVLSLDGQVHSGKIIGGHEAVPHSRPYMVLLERYMPGGSKKYCGGFLLSKDFVMTAAHCQAKSFTVLLGVHNILKTNEVQRILVEQAFPHEGYNATTYINDVMLLKLSSKANFNDNVGPIALAGRDDDSLPKSCTVYGWGQTDRKNGLMSTKLMEVSVTVIDNDGCAMENAYCSEGESGPGQGDSGGPLVCDGKAYGVVSSTYIPNSGGPLLHRFAKIPDTKNWISSTTENALIKM